MENMDLFKEQLNLTETCEYKIFNERYLKEISVGSSSKGNQEKWYDTNNKYFIKAAFYYENKYWQDYLVEIIVSKLARQMNLGQIRVVNQHRCLIKKKDNIVNGVFSKDFRDKESQIFIPFNRLLKLHADEGIIFGFPGKRFDTIVQAIKKYTKLNITDYLIVMILLDFLVGNEDRHLNNFGVISDGDEFKVAPLFDFGLGMFEHNSIYYGRSLTEAVDLMQAKPFCANPVGIINWLKNNYRDKIYSFLPESFTIAGFQFPSKLAEEYFRWACNELGVLVNDQIR